MKPWFGPSLSLLVVGLPLVVCAQDAPEEKGPPPVEAPAPDGPVTEEKRIVIVQGHDEDGPGDVIILEGEDAEGFELEMFPDMPPPEGGAKARIRLDLDGEGFDLELEGTPEEVQEQMKAVRKRLEALGADLPEGGPRIERRLDIDGLGERIKAASRERQAARAKRTRQDAVEALALDSEASSVVVPLLERVLEARRALEQGLARRRADLRRSLQRSEDDAALRKQVDALRAAGRRDRQALATAREALREVLTVPQEVQLVLRDILD